MIFSIFAFAYGRVSRELSWRPFAYLALAVLLIVLLTGYLWELLDPSYVLRNFVANYLIFLALFGFGHLVGRWLDRDKYPDS